MKQQPGNFTQYNPLMGRLGRQEYLGTVDILPGSQGPVALYMSIILIDDMVAADPKGKYHQLGQPATANLAVALQAVGLEAIAQSEHPAAIKFAVFERLNQMVLAIRLVNMGTFRIHKRKRPIGGLCMPIVGHSLGQPCRLGL